MNLIELYALLDKIQKIVGNDCRLDTCVRHSMLEMRFTWWMDEELFQYIKCVSFTEMKCIYDVDALLDLICIEAKRQYKVKTGEE